MKRLQMGDTIVEVIMAVAVTSVVLAGSFVAVNRSLKTTRAAQERGEAVATASSQIERLKYLSANPKSGSDILQNGLFCVTSSFTTPQLTDPSVSDDDSLGGCQTSGLFVSSITYDNTSHIYQIRVLWPNATGTNAVDGYPGYDQLKMYYRIN